LCVSIDNVYSQHTKTDSEKTINLVLETITASNAPRIKTGKVLKDAV